MRADDTVQSANRRVRCEARPSSYSIEEGDDSLPRSPKHPERRFGSNEAQQTIPLLDWKSIRSSRRASQGFLDHKMLRAVTGEYWVVEPSPRIKGAEKGGRDG